MSYAEQKWMVDKIRDGQKLMFGMLPYNTEGKYFQIIEKYSENVSNQTWIPVGEVIGPGFFIGINGTLTRTSNVIHSTFTHVRVTIDDQDMYSMRLSSSGQATESSVSFGIDQTLVTVPNVVIHDPNKTIPLVNGHNLNAPIPFRKLQIHTNKDISLASGFSGEITLLYKVYYVLDEKKGGG